MSNLLIVDDDVAICRTLQLHYSSQGHKVFTTHSVNDGLLAAASNEIDLIILDLQMPNKSGLEGLPDFREIVPNAPIIMITAYHDMETTIEAMKQGAGDYIHKPVDINELDLAIESALSRSSEEDTNISLPKSNKPKSDSQDFSMAGHSPAMREIYKTIGLIANKPINVLISGESGTGKELVARAIHQSSNRKSGSYIAVNCAALVETLLESDLFGHEKGAFTGAVNKHMGKFAMAENGSLFLDEIGELSPAIQAKLLRVLQEKEYTPVGSSTVYKTNARIIAATNNDLEEKVKLGLFREDLFYRLQVVNINIPPLRERKDDLMDLIQSLLGRINREMENSICRLSTEVINAFHSEKPRAENDQQFPVRIRLDEMEKIHVTRVLKSTNWHKGETCNILGVSRPRLRRIIKQHGLADPNGLEEEEIKLKEA